MPLLADTGVLYALADRDDAWHARCVAHLRSSRAVLLVPALVIPETTYLIQTRLGARAERRFVGALAARELTIESMRDEDWRRCAELLEAYPAIGLVDASVAAAAERLKLDTIATTDRRHFAALRPRHRAAFNLVP